MWIAMEPLKTGPYPLNFVAGYSSEFCSCSCAKMHQQGRSSGLLVQGWLYLGYSELTTATVWSHATKLFAKNPICYSYLSQGENEPTALASKTGVHPCTLLVGM